MAEFEPNSPLFSSKDTNKVGNLDRRLQELDATSEIEIYAVAHDWKPGQIIDLANQADVVTLELTRNVVTAGLAHSDSPVLDKNIFWRELIDGLRDNSENKLIRGVEVNQTVRTALKRLSLSMGSREFSTAIMSVEVNDPALTDIEAFLEPKDAEIFRKFGWLTVNDEWTATKVLEAVNAAYTMMSEGKIPKNRRVPLSFPQNLSMITDKLDDVDSFNGEFPILFMKSPDPSLVESTDQLKEMFCNLPFGLSPQEAASYASSVMTNFLLSHSELTDARQILYNTYQFVKDSTPANMVKTIHIGGAHHAESIQYALNKHIPPNSRISVEIKQDPRFPIPILEGSIGEFFKKQIPFEQRLNGVFVENFETFANPTHIVSQATDAIENDPEDFLKRVYVDRLIAKLFTKFNGEFTAEQAQIAYPSQTYLHRKSIEELEQLLELDYCPTIEELTS